VRLRRNLGLQKTKTCLYRHLRSLIEKWWIATGNSSDRRLLKSWLVAYLDRTKSAPCKSEARKPFNRMGTIYYIRHMTNTTAQQGAAYKQLGTYGVLVKKHAPCLCSRLLQVTNHPATWSIGLVPHAVRSSTHSALCSTLTMMPLKVWMATSQVPVLRDSEIGDCRLEVAEH
jgi:hypothetical protein